MSALVWHSEHSPSWDTFKGQHSDTSRLPLNAPTWTWIENAEQGCDVIPRRDFFRWKCNAPLVLCEYHRPSVDGNVRKTDRQHVEEKKEKRRSRFLNNPEAKMMEASEEIKDSEASNATREEVTPPKVGCHEDVCSEEKPECELSETEKKKMMEALGEKGDVSAASNTTEEDKNPPKETNSNCNHGDEDSADCSTEAAAAAAQVSVETDQSR
ncbi:hypothetical protein AMECASPLE_004601, partial [Ameca splendens]